MERANELVMDISYMIYDTRFHSLISCLWNTSAFVRSSTRGLEIIMLQKDSPEISGIQLARALQKNSPLGGKASGSSSDPTQI